MSIQSGNLKKQNFKISNENLENLQTNDAHETTALIYNFIH